MDLYFTQEWDRVSEEDTLNLKDAYRFVKDIMTIPILRKDPIVHFTVEHNSTDNTTLQEQNSSSGSNASQ